MWKSRTSAAVGEDGNDLYRGVKATADIRSEDDLVRLPRAACMLVIEGQENPHEEYISNELWAKAGDERWALRVALVLLYEKSLGRQSKFYEYIEQLPKSFENLGTWTEGEVRELQYSVGEKFAKEQRMENEKACELIQNYARDGLKKTAEEEVIWALDVVRSRVFSGETCRPSCDAEKVVAESFVGWYSFRVVFDRPDD